MRFAPQTIPASGAAPACSPCTGMTAAATWSVTAFVSDRSSGLRISRLRVPNDSVPMTRPPIRKRGQKRTAWPSQKKKTIISRCNIHQGNVKILNRFTLSPQHMADIVDGRYSDEVNDPPPQVWITPRLPFLLPGGIVAEELEVE